MPENSKPKLIYVGDPMCSWCYGISEHLAEVKLHYDSRLDFEIILGGLRPYNKQTMPELKSFLTGHWEEVHKASGLEFSYDILDREDLAYDTEPPCRATVVVRHQSPNQAFEFFKEAQKTFYVENQNMNLASSYHPILKKLNLDVSRFDAAFASDEMKEAVRKDFERSAALGVTGFPALLLEYEGKRYFIARGFSSAEEMISRIEGVLGNK